MRVLVVDDDAFILDFVDWALAEEGHEVWTAPNGAIALEMLGKVRPDIILLDMRMPVMDGWDFAEAFLASSYPPCPIVVLTAAQDPAARAKDIGADGYLSKPFNLNDLMATIDRFSQASSGYLGYQRLEPAS